MTRLLLSMFAVANLSLAYPCSVLAEEKEEASVKVKPKESSFELRRLRDLATTL